MAPRFVAPYRKNGKNDGNDAEAICEAVTRPQHALHSDQDARAAGGAVPAPRATRVYRGADGDDQPAARAAGGVWVGAAAEQCRHAPRVQANCSSSCRRTLHERWGICSITFARSTHACASTSTRSKRTLGRITPHGSPCTVRASVRSRLRRLLPASATCVSSKTAGSSRLGSASCLVNTPPAVNSGSATSQAVAIRTCARSSSWAREACCSEPPGRTILCRAGRSPCELDGAITALVSRWPLRTRASSGPCSISDQTAMSPRSSRH